MIEWGAFHRVGAARFRHASHSHQHAPVAVPMRAAPGSTTSRVPAVVVTQKWVILNRCAHLRYQSLFNRPPSLLVNFLIYTLSIVDMDEMMTSFANRRMPMPLAGRERTAAHLPSCACSVQRVQEPRNKHLERS